MSRGDARDAHDPVGSCGALFCRLGHGPCTLLQIVQLPGVDGPPDEAQGWVADGGGHPAHLSIAPFCDGQLDPSVGHRFADPDRRIARPKPSGFWDWVCLAGPRGPVFQCQPLAKRLQAGAVRLTLDLGEVGLGFAVFGVGDLCLKTPVIGEQKEPFAVAVQTSCRVHTGLVDKVRQRRARRAGGAFVGELTQNAKGFVEQYKDILLQISCSGFRLTIP